MRALFLPLFAVNMLMVVVLPGQAAAQGAKEKEAAAPARRQDAGEAKQTALKKEPVWKVRHLSISTNGANVMLEDTANRRLQSLTGPNRLLSIQYEVETGGLRVKALVSGKEIEIAQPISELGVPESSRRRAGQSEEDRRDYEALTEAQRDTFRNKLREKFSSGIFRELPEEERRAQVRALFDEVKQGKADASEPKVTEKKTEPALNPETKAAKDSVAAETARSSAVDREKYENLSEKARDKFREALRDKFSNEAFRNAPGQERRQAIRDIFEKIEKEDKEAR